ncbi:hypothetical protein [Corynebacterium glyciniphilum]|uniref:hypothetical protein n=1 Tax=Corynebacterium glyciniphilum TaxID=1404244 RepID=UPI00264ABB51|nr:hypothetical protein [Corynebacterium glyciniphilum]MDN5684074.1 hypothetical protein [Corynebacterium glyciniphilum]MDN6705092.1 hypothetical protein [Corynebacterium glyciniphilum]
MAENDGWGRRDSGDSTREFRPAPGGDQNPYPQWGQAAGGQPDWGQPPPPQQPHNAGGSSAGRALLVVIPVLIIVLVAALLVWKWDDFFGSGSDDAAAPAPMTSQSVPSSEEATAEETSEEPPSETGNAARPDRPDRPDLPSGAEPVNDAARNNEPTGDFNSVYKSPPSGDNYTSDEFAEAVRNAFVDAYLDNRETDQTIDVRSPVTGDNYQMTCTDEGSYVHCAGGNNANVYIA